MNIRKSYLSTALGLSLVALLSNNALAHEQYTGKGECAQGASEQGYAGHFEKRMASLHTDLKLSAAQESAWNEFAGKVKPAEIKPHEHQNWANLSTPDRLDRMVEHLKTHQTRMAEHATAVRAFYDVLSAEQKKTFDGHFQKRPHPRDHEMHDKN